MRQRFQLIIIEIKPCQRDLWELKSNDKSNAVLCQVGQLANRIWQWSQLVFIESEPIKESDENWNQILNKSNLVPGQVGQLADTVRYKAQMVVAEPKPIKEWWETVKVFSTEILTLSTPGSPSTARPSPGPFHTVSTCPRASPDTTWFQWERIPWEICKRGKDIVSKPSQSATISSSLQPATCVSTHLPRLKLETGKIRKRLHSPHPLRLADEPLSESPCQRCTLTALNSDGHAPSRHRRLRAFLRSWSKRQLCDARTCSRRKTRGKCAS